MKFNCIYYSMYPYTAEDFRVVEDPEGCGDAFDMPFRLYKAAECSGNDAHVLAFLHRCWEVMDRPDCKGVDDIHSPYELDGVSVIPTKHFYGATNSRDGVYEVDNAFYVINYDCEWRRFETFRDALVFCYTYYINRGYLQGCELAPVIN